MYYVSLNETHFLTFREATEIKHQEVKIHVSVPPVSSLPAMEREQPLALVTSSVRTDRQPVRRPCASSLLSSCKRGKDSIPKVL